MTQEEFLNALIDKQRVVEVLEKRLNSAKASLNNVYTQRAKTIAETNLHLTHGEKITLYINDNNKIRIKKGFFDCIIYNSESDAFAIRLFPMKKDGTAYKTPESNNNAINITDLSQIEKK